MKRKIIYILIICLVCISISACQPTPDKPVVVNKGDNGLEQQIKETASPSASASPSSKNEKWQETIDEGGVHLVINADIEVPKVSAWPVVKATPHELTMEDVQKAVDVFMKGKTLYEYNGVRPKANVEKDILWAQGMLNQAKTDTSLSASFLKQKLGDLKSEYDNAPQEPGKKKAEMEFKRNPDKNSGYNRTFDVEADLGNTEPAVLDIDSSDDSLLSLLDFSNYNNNRFYYSLFEATDKLTGLKISKEDALKVAQDTLHKLGLTDVQLSDTKAGIDMYGIKQAAYSSKISEPDRKKCFVFYFSRVVQGIPVTNVAYCNGVSGDSDEKYEKVWTSEDIQIAVDDSGILWFRWDSPGDTGDTVNANVKLKDLSDIKSIFKKQIFYQKSWTAQAVKENVITIKKAVLGLMRVKLKEKEYAYMPVWDFIGDWKTNGSVGPHSNESFLTLNAVDGSVINRELGY